MGSMGFPSIGRGYRAGVFSVSLALGSAGAWADTIVLKNGHRISASNVMETGDKIRYETSEGELSLPKSIVDHIEKGSYVSNMAITPPVMDRTRDNGGEIEHAVIRGGAIDRQYIAKLESETRSGSAAAGMDAAVAHHAAASFELAHGDMDHALADERTALTFAPEEPLLLMNVAYLHLRRSEYRESLDYLERAKRIAANNPDVAKLSGWAYYGMNKLPQAVEEWKRALALRPDAEVQTALQKAERDQGEEGSYKENESAHFTLRYNGSAEPTLAREVLRTLEMHYTRINSELNFAPADAIGVILYTQQAFADITRAPGWVGALNDGRLRVPVQGLSSMTDELSRVLQHELTHSFVQQKTHGRAPTWIQEGLAQWMEGKRSGDNAAALLEIYGDGHAISLGSLEGSWMGFPSDAAVYAYAWALANIEYIVQADGMGDVERILDRIGSGSSTESALHDVLHSDYGDVMRSSADYLRRRYSR
jgi:tetratricopeptide (TPR) repeat protein